MQPLSLGPLVRGREIILLSTPLAIDSDLCLISWISSTNLLYVAGDLSSEKGWAPMHMNFSHLCLLHPIIQSKSHDKAEELCEKDISRIQWWDDWDICLTVYPSRPYRITYPRRQNFRFAVSNLEDSKRVYIYKVSLSFLNTQSLFIFIFFIILILTYINLSLFSSMYLIMLWTLIVSPSLDFKVHVNKDNTYVLYKYI